MVEIVIRNEKSHLSKYPVERKVGNFSLKSFLREKSFVLRKQLGLSEARRAD